MEYTIKKVRFGKNNVFYVPVFEDGSLKLLEEFLMTEVKSFRKRILAILSDPGDTEFAGNVCRMQIRGDRVRLEATLDEADLGAPVELDRQELTELVHAWIADTKG